MRSSTPWLLVIVFLSGVAGGLKIAEHNGCMPTAAPRESLAELRLPFKGTLP